MPRKKVTTPIHIGGATGRSKQRRVLTDYRSETGDPWEDGEIWLTRIGQARQARNERENGEKKWRNYYRWYAGRQWDDRGDWGGQISADNARDTATVNKVGSIINSIRPFLINDEIKFLLKPQRPADATGVKIQQALLNYEWRERNMTRPVKACALDLLIIGHCVGKSGYTVEVDESKAKDEVINYADYVKRDAPFLERVNPLHFLFDTFGRDHSLHTARWCAEYLFVPFTDVLENKSYDRETVSLLQSGSASVTTLSSWEMQLNIGRRQKEKPIFTLPEDRIVALIEIWDWKTKQRMIYPDGCVRPLLVEDWPFGHLDKFPYSMANYIEVPNEPYGLGVPAWIEDQAMQLNRMATLEQDVARKSRPRIAAGVGTDAAEVTKYANGDEVVVGEFKAIQLPTLPQDFQIIQANIQRVIEEMTGADALLQGSRLPSRTTAGEIGTRARLTGLKLDQHVEDFEVFVEDLATQVLHHLKKFRTVDDVIEIVGDEGAEWREYTNEEIQDDVDVDVEYFAAPKTDLELEKMSRKEILQLIVSAMPVMAERTDTIPNIPAVLEWVLDAYGEKDTARFFRSPMIAGGPTGGGAGPGQGLPPEMAGALAPAQIGQTPGVGDPAEGMSLEDRMMSLRGMMQ